MLEPLGAHPGDGVVLLGGSLACARKLARCAFAHGSQQIVVDLLLEVDGFL